jgi:hypothetical protein
MKRCRDYDGRAPVGEHGPDPGPASSRQSKTSCSNIGVIANGPVEHCRQTRPRSRCRHRAMKFVATKTADQLDLQALHRVRERLVSQRTGVINQIRAFLLERGVAVRQGLRFLRTELPLILATRCDVLSPRMMRIIEDLAGDWRRLQNDPKDRHAMRCEQRLNLRLKSIMIWQFIKQR